MGASQTKICNLALGKIGAGIIVSLDEGTTEANACNVIYDAVRDEVLALRPWASCTKRTTLALLSDAPAFEFDYAYQVPSDFLSMQRFGADINTEPPYRIEGRSLLTDEETAYAIYTFRNTDTISYEPALVDLIASRMAVDLAMSVARNSSLRADCERIFEAKLIRYQAVDGLAVGRVQRTPSGFAEARS